MEEVLELIQFNLESHQAQEVEQQPTSLVKELAQVQSFLVAGLVNFLTSRVTGLQRSCQVAQEEQIQMQGWEKQKVRLNQVMGTVLVCSFQVQVVVYQSSYLKQKNSLQVFTTFHFIFLTQSQIEQNLNLEFMTCQQMTNQVGEYQEDYRILYFTQCYQLDSYLAIESLPLRPFLAITQAVGSVQLHKISLSLISPHLKM